MAAEGGLTVLVVFLESVHSYLLLLLVFLIARRRLDFLVVSLLCPFLREPDSVLIPLTPVHDVIPEIGTLETGGVRQQLLFVNGPLSPVCL